ncbi:hypothetical protein ABZ905_28280 [Streptomyces parvus]|uniref:hypothetical protein n=1 Tax=Streptomyces parvus TaxID=66428 RepID=UPI00340C8380
MIDRPPPRNSPDPSDGPCDVHDVLALADDEHRCCVRHHPEAARHDHNGYRPPAW